MISFSQESGDWTSKKVDLTEMFSSFWDGSNTERTHHGWSNVSLFGGRNFKIRFEM
jgi:hypothetical protein